MFRIGDFSQLGQVSIRTLRLYDEMNLLKPAQIDKFTGYRYYAIEQLPRLNRILALKDLGRYARQIGKPCLVVALEEGIEPATFRDWLAENHITVLNVAGPRASQRPGVYAAACRLLDTLLQNSGA